MKITAANLIRWAGLAAVAAGLIFAGIQPIHPPDVVASVTTDAWAIITRLKTAMCLLFLLGIAGIYARQVEQAGWLGLAGFLLFSLSWALQTAFVFAEAFILPLLATDAPAFVDGVLGMSYGQPSAVDLGALPALYALVGILYLLGGLLLGIATLRAGILPRRAAGLLAVTATLTPAAVLLPHHLQRLAAVPMGIALAWLGYALWAEGRVTGRRRRRGRGHPMTAGREPTLRLPPRWFVRTAWVVHRALYACTGGRLGLWRPQAGGRFGTLRLTTHGRRSGRPRVAILGYYEDGPDLVTLAMNGWADPAPAWWLNLRAHPDATVDLADGPRAVRARSPAGADRARRWARFRDFPGWGDDLDARAARRATETAVVVLEPRPAVAAAGGAGVP